MGPNATQASDTAEQDRCQGYIDRYMKQSPMVKFLLAAMTKTGCPTPAIRCAPCPEAVQATGTFDPKTGIVLCQNWLDNGLQAEDTLSHELIHAYDYCRVKFDFANCRHHACSEIRAANLSGDCKWSRELFRGNATKLAAQHQACVQRRAILSLKSNPACADCKDIDKLVKDVFPHCFSDTAPFLDIP